MECGVSQLLNGLQFITNHVQYVNYKTIKNEYEKILWKTYGTTI